ncbi:MAG: DUF1559 domain-containing protein, partial [Planctomycetia bacterium]
FPDSANAYVPHYYGVMGAKGINPADGSAYPLVGPGSVTLAFGRFATTGVLFRNSSVRPQHVLDGLSTTLFVGEQSWHTPSQRTWLRGTADGHSGGAKNIQHPINSLGYNVSATLPIGGTPSFNDVSMGSRHSGGGTHFVMGDGTIRFLSENINLNVYRALATRALEEPVSVP